MGLAEVSPVRSEAVNSVGTEIFLINENENEMKEKKMYPKKGTGKKTSSRTHQAKIRYTHDFAVLNRFL